MGSRAAGREANMNTIMNQARVQVPLKGLAAMLLLVLVALASANTAFAATARTWRTSCDGATGSTFCQALCNNTANFGDTQWPGYCQATWCPANTGDPAYATQCPAPPAVTGNLNLAAAPLFLSQKVDSNVFFELDDSGSMDFEILPGPHWMACEYDRNHPVYSGGYAASRCVDEAGNGSKTEPETSGLMNIYTERENRVRVFYNVFENSDNWYNYRSVEDHEENSGKVVKNDWRVLSSALNATYYNPANTYTKWPLYETVGGLASTYSPAFTSVKSHPMPGMAGYTVTRDLSQTSGSYIRASNGGTSSDWFEFHVWIDDYGWCKGDAKPMVGTLNPCTGQNHNRVAGSNGWVDLWDSHIRYRVDMSGGTAAVRADLISYTIDSAGRLTENIVKTATFSGTSADPFDSDINGDGVIDGTGRTANELASQVAMWYEFGRKRTFVARQSIGEVVLQNDGLRYGLGFIKKVPGNSYTNGGKSLLTRVRISTALTGPYNNSSLYTNLYYHDLDEKPTGTSGRGGTPLRTGYKDVWNYFDSRSNTTNNPIVFSCQHNFAIVITDGYYNGGESISGVDDDDGDGAKDKMSDIAYKLGMYSGYDLHEGFANLVPIKTATGKVKKQQHMITFPVSFGVPGRLIDTTPVPDGWPDWDVESLTAFDPVIDPTKLGDPAVMASKYWNGNDVPETSGQDDPEKIDDLWHAAYNGNGQFVSARNPAELLKGFEKVFSVISSVVSSSSALASTSGRAQGEALLYLAQFNSEDWSGNLVAVKTKVNGGVESVPTWQTDITLPHGYNHNKREIVTFNPRLSAGIPFRFPADYKSPNLTLPGAEMNTVESYALLTKAPFPATTTVASEVAANQAYGTALVNYLRGDTSQEGSGSTYKFRKRNKLLGDVIGSAPEFVGRPDESFPNSIAPSSPYSSYVSKYKDRTPMVYVGANDGMLHGFDASANLSSSGKEVFAYVPAMVYPKLWSLSDPAYAHEFYVNAPTNSMDVQDSSFPSSDYNWQTILVGALGQGGQGIYALNVTNPSDLKEGNADKIAMWEFLHRDDVDLGYIIHKIPVVKLNNGRWGAIFGNGYNSKVADGYQGRGSAVLFIVDAVTGALIKKIDTLNTGTTTLANGLSGPAVVDFDGNWTADFVYAGDLQGNLWKFDIQDASAANWDLAYGAGKPLFKTATGQPITVQPKVAKSPYNGYMILFGTGKYLEVGDNVVTSTYPNQAFYAIWDRVESKGSFRTITVSDLFAQKIILEVTGTVKDPNGNDLAYGLRFTEPAAGKDPSTGQFYEPTYVGNRPDMGWYLPLVNPNDNLNHGERSVTDPQLASDASRVVFTSWVPTQDPCEVGGYSWLMELDTISGNPLNEPPFDLSKDGQFDIKDLTYENLSKYVKDGTIPSGMRFDGLVQTPELVKGASTGSGGCISEGKYMSDTTGDIQSVQESSDCTIGRVSWRHLN